MAGLLSLVLATSAAAQGTGRSLDIQPGGRQNGMGAAGVALADDPSATWWNPAALGFMTRNGFELTYAQLVPNLASDVTYNYLSYVHPMQGWGALGVGFVFLNYGQSEGRDESGNFTKNFGSNEFSPALYYGTQILPDFSVGAALKYIRIQLAPNDFQGVGSTFGLDLASMYRIPAAKLSLGLNVQNLGPSVAFVNEERADPLSRNIKTGFAWEAVSIKEYGLLVAGDFNQSLVTSEFRTYHGGVELRYSDQIAGRVGWYEDRLGEISDLTYGVGMSFKGLNVDWGSIPEAKNSGLGNVQKITLGYRF
ncbi:MAG: PorV/PorQ family protein [Candidatus Eisenbacteria bacterium]|uniref:PorV/PorQ family protein n=1 Tax=Eiseniibacteriota bacterium TaxID=2212470 RepID=A0A538TVB3_UNCEI|nr:MAG: PorV/PorQ family protein [Candidatus Eisenbacteria bacterium]